MSETKTNDTGRESVSKELADLRKQIESLRNENATRRIKARDSNKQLVAMETVLKAHNIDFDVEKADLSNIDLDNRTGFDYQVSKPKLNEPKRVERGGPPSKLTVDDVSKMSKDDIKDNWELVMKTMKRKQFGPARSHHIYT